MSNTGYKGYTALQQYYTDDSSSTGTTKANSSSDPNYIAPVLDTGTCATTTYYSAVYSATAYRNNCGDDYSGTGVTLSSTYGQFTSIISQADADAQAAQWVEANKQSNANSNGSCTLLTVMSVYMTTLTINTNTSKLNYQLYVHCPSGATITNPTFTLTNNTTGHSGTFGISATHGWAYYPSSTTGLCNLGAPNYSGNSVTISCAAIGYSVTVTLDFGGIS
jgi:hypothetical protein